MKEEERLLKLVEEKSLKRGEFTLSSGLKTSYYFDGRLTTLWPEGVYLVGKKMLQLAAEAGAEAIGGPTLGADSIVAAAALISWLEGQPLPAFIVRQKPKEHGMQRYIEGHLPSGGRAAIVDDVITTGSAILQAIEAVEGEGCRVARVIALLDRQQGGSEEIRRRGYNFISLLVADPSGKVKLAGKI